MILHHIPLSEDFETLELFVFSDLHVGDPHFNEDLFYECREWVLGAPNRFCGLNGDIMNVALKDSISDVYGDVLNPADQLRWAKKEFAPLRDRVLWILPGNHENRIRRATSIDVIGQLAESLGCESRYFPDGALLKLTFGAKKKNGKRAVYTLYATHGSGGGAFVGAKALKMQRMSNIVLADVYVMSHTHVKMAFKEAVYVPDLYNNNVRLMEQTFVNSSALLNWGGYAEVKGYKPGAQASPHIILHADPKRVEVTL